ncbi:MAG TPA: sigma-70 family RNA polymerase sigma factor, partial [Armatimonadota bacterium]|nr:sigma-70 family RNA polymerase sigma factor [Armatimonadota bacterium]
DAGGGAMTLSPLRDAHLPDLYPHVTPQMWSDGYRYVLILTERYTRRLPSWLDRPALEAAAIEALLVCARLYAPEKGAWSTFLDLTTHHRLYREYQRQVNWFRGAAPTARARTYTGNQEGPLYLDSLLGEDGQSFTDLLPDERPTPEAALCAAAERVWLEQAVNCLPAGQREAVAGYYLHGKTQRALAGEMGVSYEAVRLRIKRGLGRLRARFGEGEER